MTDGEKVETRRVCVVVLGDIGRSPRMQYHAASLADAGFLVDFVGYSGSKPHQHLISNSNITFNYMSDVPGFGKYLPRIVCYFLKVLWQSFALLFTLLLLSRPNYILVQNPPSIPTLPVVWFFARCRRVNFIVDWHNYGFTILGLSLGPDHPLVKMCRWCEGFFGARADSHFCVTKALKSDLLSRWNICATVLYDRPASFFREISTEEKCDILAKLSSQYPGQFGDEEDSDFAQVGEGGDIVEKANRPAILVSSTSWTEDEDFNILLEALQNYDSRASIENSELPRLVCVITGKGPLKEKYQGIISQLSLINVSIVLPWLEPEDYPRVLAAADLGVCLHTSSSSLDLPMKVVDMFGCCLPVCAIAYNCLHELVHHDENGLHFRNSSELTDQLETLLSSSGRKQILPRYQDNLRAKYAKLRWDSTWKENALPLFQN